MNENFSDFGRGFQEDLTRLIIKERAFSDQIREVLKVEFFELKYLQEVVRALFDYKDQYKTHPTIRTLGSVLKSSDTDDELLKSQIMDFYDSTLAGEQEIKDTQFVKDKSLDFCKKQHLREALLQSVDLMKKSSFDDIGKIIETALRKGLDYDVGHEYLQDFESRYVEAARAPITTGWQLMDSITDGGLGVGELGVVIASTGVGKSVCLVHFGAQAILQGKTVVHYTLELSDKVIGKRYDACITRIPLDDLKSRKEEVQKIIGEKATGTLVIKQYPTKKATINTLRAHLDKLFQRGIEPSMVIVDYGDLLRPVQMQKEKRHDLESIYEELRAIAEEYHCSVWTASQGNRNSVDAELVDLDSISEAFNKCFVSDLILTLSRTREDLIANTGRIFVAKNRFGNQGYLFPIFMDTATLTINLLTPAEEEAILGDKEAIKSKQKERLQKKYVNYLNGNKK